MRPSALTNAIFLYVLAVAARLYGMQVHAACVLSNHYHLLVTDPAARLPDFMRYLDGLVARAVNSSLGHWEGLWSSDHSYSDVEPVAPEDVIAKTVYVLANPVSAGLVPSGREWPGVWTAPEQLGNARLVTARPKVFFREKGDMPASGELELTPPPGFSAEEFQRLAAAALREREDEVRRERGSRDFLGRRRVLAQDPFAHPGPGEPRRQMNPRVAARDKWQRIEALSGLVAFLQAYRSAWRARRAGVLEVVFPAGTFQLRVEHGVRCAPA